MGSKSRIRGRRLDGNCGTRCALVLFKRVEATPILALPGGLPFWVPACALSRTLSFSAFFQKNVFLLFFKRVEATPILVLGARMRRSSTSSFFTRGRKERRKQASKDKQGSGNHSLYTPPHLPIARPQGGLIHRVLIGE